MQQAAYGALAQIPFDTLETLELARPPRAHAELLLRERDLAASAACRALVAAALVHEHARRRRCRARWASSFGSCRIRTQDSQGKGTKNKTRWMSAVCVTCPVTKKSKMWMHLERLSSHMFESLNMTQVELPVASGRVHGVNIKCSLRDC